MVTDSKEAFKCIKKYFEEHKYTTYNLWQMCKQVQKDLEVLEIFKKAYNIQKEYLLTVNYDDLDDSEKNALTEGDWLKIKEWLENDS